jgi:hypothetical protein
VNRPILKNVPNSSASRPKSFFSCPHYITPVSKMKTGLGRITDGAIFEQPEYNSANRLADPSPYVQCLDAKNENSPMGRRAFGKNLIKKSGRGKGASRLRVF